MPANTLRLAVGIVAATAIAIGTLIAVAQADDVICDRLNERVGLLGDEMTQKTADFVKLRALRIEALGDGDRALASVYASGSVSAVAAMSGIISKMTKLVQIVKETPGKCGMSDATLTVLRSRLGERSRELDTAFIKALNDRPK